MVKVPAPPKSRLAITAPTLAEVPNNLSKTSTDLQDMNFKVSSDFHRKFKSEAVIRGMRMKDFMEACFYNYLKHYPRDPE